MPPNEAARHLPLDIVCDGVIITRTVRAHGALLHAASERHFASPKLPPIGLVEGPGKKRLRIGLVLDSVEGDPTDAPTRAAVLDVAKHLEALGHTVSEVQLPPETSVLAVGLPSSVLVDDRAYLTTAFGKGQPRSRLRRIARRRPHARPSLASTGAACCRLPGALLRLARSARIYARTLTDYDAMLSPVVAHITPKLGHLSPEVDFETLFARLRNFVAFTPLNNATGSPAMSVPLGSTSDGLPIGVHFSGRHGDERTLLELAYELEQSRPFRRKSNT